MDGELAGDGFSYGGLERGKRRGRWSTVHWFSDETLKNMDKTSYLGFEEYFIPCQNTVFGL